MTESEKQLTCNAVNLLMLKGLLPSETNYAFHTQRGVEGVLFWIPCKEDPNSFKSPPRFFDYKEIIASAGTLNAVSGKSDSV